jgi:hypothetical protein
MEAADFDPIHAIQVAAGITAPHNSGGMAQSDFDDFYDSSHTTDSRT